MKRIFTSGLYGYPGSARYRILIAAPTDVVDESFPTSAWGNLNVLVEYTGSEVFDGQDNTDYIIQADSLANNAARLCRAYGSGYDLPSKDELEAIYEAQAWLSGIDPAASYWSSTEKDITTAYAINMGTGAFSTPTKNLFRKVRPVRSIYADLPQNPGFIYPDGGKVLLCEEMDEITHEINIYDTTLSGDSPDALTLLAPGYTIDWDSGINDVVRGGFVPSEARIVVANTFQNHPAQLRWRAFLNTLSESSEYRFILEIKKNNALWWCGCLLSDFSGLADNPMKTIELSAVDGLAYLKGVEASDLNHVSEHIGGTGYEHLNDLHYIGILGDILYGLKKIPTAGLFWKQSTDEERETKFLYVRTDWFGQGMLETDEPFEKAFVKPYQGTVAWGKREKTTGVNGQESETITWMTYYEVIQHILTRFKAILMFQNGAWYLTQRECLENTSEITYHTYRREAKRVEPAAPDWTAEPSIVTEKAFVKISDYENRFRSDGQFMFLPGLNKARVKYVAGDEFSSDSLLPIDYKPEITYTTIPLESGAGNFLQIRVGFRQEFSSPDEFPECGFFRAIPRYRVYLKLGTDKWWNGAEWVDSEAFQTILGTRLEYTPELANQSNGEYSTILPQDSGVETTLFDTCFTDVNTGWACGASGVIRRTQNAGATPWTAIPSGINTTLRALNFPSFYVGYFVGLNGKILKTSNGATIQQLVSGTTQNLHGVFFTDNNRGWAVGANGTILRTINGGSTWTAQVSGTTKVLYSITSFNTGGGFWATLAVGEDGVMLYSTNDGTTWNDVTSSITPIIPYDFYKIVYKNNKVWILGEHGSFYYSDSLFDFIQIDTGVTTPLYDLQFNQSGTIGIAVGSGALILRSADSGASWDSASISTDNIMYGTGSASSGEKWFACGQNGEIAWSNDSGATWIEEPTEPTINEALTFSDVIWSQNTTDIPEDGVVTFLLTLHDYIIELVQSGSTLTFHPYPTIDATVGEHGLLYIVDNNGPVTFVQYEAQNENIGFNIIHEEEDSIFGSAQTIYGQFITPIGAKWGKGFSSAKDLYFNQLLAQEIVQNQNHALMVYSGRIFNRNTYSAMTPIQAVQFSVRSLIYRFSLNKIRYNAELESYEGDWVEISKTRLRITNVILAEEQVLNIDLSPQSSPPTPRLPRINVNFIELTKIPRWKNVLVNSDKEALGVDDSGNLVKKSSDGSIALYKAAGGCSINDTTIGGVKVRIFIDEILNVPEWYHYNTLELQVDGDLVIFGQVNILDIPQGGSPTPTPYDKRTEWVSLLLMYQGFAPQGSLETAAVWTIYKIVTLATGGVVSNTEYTDKKWTERELL